MTNLQKLMDIKNALNAKYFEREDEIEAILIAILSKQHMLMIGSPGTGKSALSADLSNIFQGMSYFQWLLTKFSTPEELFGALSLKELENGVYKRNTTNKMPEAHLTFLDEIFKANSAILNSLLTLINERLFYNDGQPIQVPLMSVIGSSNEYPEDEEGLEALFDRFLLRFEIDYIQDDNNFVSMLKNNTANVTLPSLTMEELTNLQFLVDMVSVPDAVYTKLAQIRMELKNEGIIPSDRRFKQSLSVLKAKALIEQRQSVEINDIVFLENALWETLDQKDKTSSIVRKFAENKVLREIQDSLNDAASISSEYERSRNEPGFDPLTHGSLEASKKMKDLILNLEEIYKQHPEHKSEVLSTIKQITELRVDLTKDIVLI